MEMNASGYASLKKSSASSRRRRDEIFAEMERVAEEEARAEREQVKASIEGRAA